MTVIIIKWLVLVMVRGSSQKFPALTYWTTIFFTVYTSVKRAFFTESYESAVDMTSL